MIHSIHPIFQLRRKLDLTQKELCNQWGVGMNYAFKLEAGERNPSRETVLALQNVSGVKRDDLNYILLYYGYAPVGSTEEKIGATIDFDLVISPEKKRNLLVTIMSLTARK